MRSGSRCRTACAVAAMLVSSFFSTAARAVDVRQPEAGASFHLDLQRAYGPCTAPDTVARNGAPACTAMVSSVCSPTGPFDVTPNTGDPTMPFATISLAANGSAPICRARGSFAIRVRTTTGASATDLGGDEPACPSGECTFPDVVADEALFFEANGFRDPNYEFVDMAFFGPDGLPIGGFNLPGGYIFGGGPTITTNLTLPYAPCTAPGPGGACDLVPPNTPCDFEMGTIEWPSLSLLGTVSAHVTMDGLAGSSPICTTGPYTLEATLRATGKVCGTVSDPERCTVVDQTVSVPLPVRGRRIDAVVPVSLGSLGKYYETVVENVGVVSARILDPLGEPVAVHGVTGVRSLLGPRVSIKGGRVRVRGVIPVKASTPAIDPTLEGGFTLTLKDRGGELYAVTIPDLRWQDQTPLGSRWTYEDPGGVLGGVRKASITRIGKAEALKGYKLDIRAEGVDLSGLAGTGVASITVGVAVTRPPFLTGGPDPEIHRAQRNCTGAFKGTKLDCK